MVQTRQTSVSPSYKPSVPAFPQQDLLLLEDLGQRVLADDLQQLRFLLPPVVRLLQTHTTARHKDGRTTFCRFRVTIMQDGLEERLWHKVYMYLLLKS